MNSIDKINKRISLEDSNQELTNPEQENKKSYDKYNFHTNANKLNRVTNIYEGYDNKTGSGTHIVSNFPLQIKVPDDNTHHEISSDNEEIQGNEEDLDKIFSKKKPILKSLNEEEKIPSYKQARDTKLIGKFCDALKKQKLLSDEQTNIVINLINNKSNTNPDYFNRSFISSLSNDHNISDFLLELYHDFDLRNDIFCKQGGIQENVLNGIKAAANSCLSDKV